MNSLRTEEIASEIVVYAGEDRIFSWSRADIAVDPLLAITSLVQAIERQIEIEK